MLTPYERARLAVAINMTPLSKILRTLRGIEACSHQKPEAKWGARLLIYQITHPKFYRQAIDVQRELDK